MTKKNKVEVGGWVGVIGSISIAGPGIGVNDIGVGQISKVGVSSQQECEGVVPPTTTGNNCKGNFGDNVDCRKITDCPQTKPNNQYTGTYPAVDGNTYYYIAGKCSGSFSTGYCCYSTNAPGNPPWTEPGRRTAPPSESARVRELKGMVGDKYNLAMYQTVYDKYSTTEKARSILKGMGITSKFTSLSQWESTVNKMSAESYKQFKTMVERTIK